MLRILEPCLRLDLTLRAYCTTILIGGSTGHVVTVRYGPDQKGES